jgi:DNA-binding NtrC family response regulator
MNHTILLVDDDQAFRSAVSRQLTITGYKVVECENGQSAIQAAKNEEFGLMIVDLNMPGIGGLDLIDSLRRQGKHWPAIILTSDETVEKVNRALQLGVYEYFNKNDFDVNALFDTVRNYI